MVYDPATRVLDFTDDSLTANTRCAYPLEAISNASLTLVGGKPRNVVMLTCDAFGVLPPIARLTPAQAMYHFLSGFTSKVAGTERGVTEPQPTFSTCFGAPFMPRRPEVYGGLLGDRIAQTGAACWLVNTGWTGGAYGTGRRMPIAATRALLSPRSAAFAARVRLPPRPDLRLRGSGRRAGRRRRAARPARDLADPAAYDAQAARLAAMFVENFAQYEEHVSDDGGRARRLNAAARPRATAALPAARSPSARRRGRASGKIRLRPCSALAARSKRGVGARQDRRPTVPCGCRVARQRHQPAADRHSPPLPRRRRSAPARAPPPRAAARRSPPPSARVTSAKIARNSSPPTRPEQVAAAAARRHAPGHLLQHPVAGGMAVAVVDRLEPVDVDHQHAPRPCRAAPLDQRAAPRSSIAERASTPVSGSKLARRSRSVAGLGQGLAQPRDLRRRSAQLDLVHHDRRQRLQEAQLPRRRRAGGVSMQESIPSTCPS